MAIRSIDYQTIIPKAPEVQKMKDVEMQNHQRNDLINLHKQQEQNQQDLKKVIETKKVAEASIKRDESKKQKNGNPNDDEEEKNKKNKRNKKQSIDIRI